MKLRSFVAVLFLSGSAIAADATVNIYSSRGESLIRPLLDTFTEQSGIKVKLLSAKPGALLTRLQLEGESTPADVLLTADVGNLSAAAAAGVLQPISSSSIEQTVPSYLKAEDNQWVGVSIRSRVIVAPKSLDSAELPTTIEALAEPRFKDSICVRSSGNVYNQSLLASLIAELGTEAATAWAQGVKDNMAREPEGNDRAQVKAVAKGVCKFGIVNTYYLGIMLSDPEQAKIAKDIQVIFTNQADRGSHINISGAGITKHAKNPENAQRLIEFLLSEDAQQWYAEVNHEYPVLNGVAASALVQSWTPENVKFDSQSVSKFGSFNPEAVKIFDQVGWQ